MSESVPALRFKGTSKEYIYSHLGTTTKTRGLDGLELSVEPGEAFGILGLNGTGKTTAMKVALGLLHPTGGSVEVFGHEPGSSEALAKVGYLPELPYIYRYLTPRRALRFYGKLSGLAEDGLDARVDEAIEMVGLSHAKDRRVAGFSKGMTQRVGLAQAVLHGPELLLLDEPVSGLDPLAIHDFRELLAGLHEKGTAMVIASHSISDLERICDRVGVLDAGKLVRTIERSEWDGKEVGTLEGLFVETVRKKETA